MKKLTLLLALILSACGGGEAVKSVSPVSVYAYGDSTQAEQGNPHAAQRDGFTIVNRGVGSSTSSDLLAIWPSQLLDPSRVVVINHGINDRDLILYKANIKALVNQAQSANKIVMLEAPNATGETMTDLMRAINFDIEQFKERQKAMREIAQSMGVYFCAQPRVPLRDGIHPTPEGYRLKAETLSVCIADIIN